MQITTSVDFDCLPECWPAEKVSDTEKGPPPSLWIIYGENAKVDTPWTPENSFEEMELSCRRWCVCVRPRLVPRAHVFRFYRWCCRQSGLLVLIRVLDLWTEVMVSPCKEWWSFHCDFPWLNWSDNCRSIDWKWLLYERYAFVVLLTMVVYYINFCSF